MTGLPYVPSQAARQRSRLSVALVRQIIFVPLLVYPIAPDGVQNDPGHTFRRTVVVELVVRVRVGEGLLVAVRVGVLDGVREGAGVGDGAAVVGDTDGRGSIRFRGDGLLEVVDAGLVSGSAMAEITDPNMHRPNSTPMVIRNV